MARRSRRTAGESAERAAPQALPTAIYARLSVENSGRDDGGAAIGNQIAVCAEYIAARTDLSHAGTYVDNGRTGTVFERPEFNRLMRDARAGRIKCVVVRDLSRFGRDYIDAGTYIERTFPQLGVRFISVKESFDSFSDGAGDGALAVPLQNIINTLYARDISRKITATFRAQTDCGEFKWRRLPYGYRRGESGRLEPDGEAAQNVKNIFKWRLEGASVSEIVKRLAAEGVYIARTSVYNILANPAYTGIHCCGFSERKPYSGAKRRPVTDSADWRVMRDTHEPLVSREDYDAARELFGRSESELGRTGSDGE